RFRGADPHRSNSCAPPQPCGCLLCSWHTSSSPGEFHPEALTEPCLSLSTHTALVIHEELSPFATISRFLLLPVDQLGHDANDLPSSLHGHYSASSLLQGSPSLNSASVLSLSWVLPTCGFSVCIGVSGSHVPFNCLMASSGHLSCRMPLRP